MLHGRKARLALVGVVFSVVASCGGGVMPKTGGTAQGSVSGVVFKGPVAAGSVRAVKLSATLERGDELASATTDAAGLFELKLPPYSGPLLIVASSGTYIEEAIGLGVKLDGSELTALIPAYTGGAVIPGLHVTPISSLATALTTFHVRHSKGVVEAHEEARLHLNAHFGAIDWSAVSPADLTVVGVTNLSPEARAGLLLSGLSWLAKQEAEASGLTPGLTVNGATLSAALVRDASDGTLDGRAGTEQLKQAKVSLSDVTLRADLVQAMTAFVNSTRNASALRLQDVTALLAAVGTNNDPYLFCPGQMAAASCGTGPVDTEPPVLAFVRPTAGAGVAGSTQVEVHASDNVKLKTLKFTSPTSLEATVPVFTNEGREGVLAAVLDVSALMDGPLELRAEVTDESGSPATKSITITVSNLGPRITIAAPADGSTVRGTSVPVIASAMAQAPGATVTRIELVGPPAGMGVDVVPAADSFSATWNTTIAPEGRTTVTVRATDSFGTSTESTITFTVDNLPFGRISALVSAGAPVDGLTVKVLAIDEATGLPVTGRLGGPVLGQSSDLTIDGGVSFDLNQENYSGPVQVVAEGSGASYIDPSNGVTNILLPATFSFTTYVASYQAGDRLDVPVTFWTTLADEAARAYALGRNPSQPTPILLAPALRTTDPLFARHITSQAWSVRSAYPARLTTSPQSLRDVVYAALPDVALNQEARDLAEQVGLTPGTGFGAPQLMVMLRQDIADGQFDGRANGVQLRTGGVTPYDFDSNTTRFRQAISLDRFIRSPQNRTGITRQDLQTQSIYDTMSGDTSLLYGTTVGPIPFDNTAPVVTWLVTFTNGGSSSPPAVLGMTHLVAGQLSIQATAVDVSGVGSITAVADTTQLVPGSGSSTSRIVSVFDTSARADGSLTLAATACDRLGNCDTTAFELEVDNTRPSITVVRPLTGYFASLPFAVEAQAADNQSVMSFDFTPVADATGLVDQDAAVARIFVPETAWQFGTQLSDGPFAGKVKACDLVRNCAEATLATIDRTPPQVAITTAVPGSTRTAALALTGTVTDGTAGVSRVLVSLNGGPAQLATLAGSTWTSALTLAEGNNSIAVWAEDLAVTPNSGQGKPSPASATATIILDTAPPTVAWTVTFTNGTIMGTAPVGASKLVGGMLSVEANATDSSRVASIAVTAGSTPLNPRNGSSASRHLSLLDTSVTGEGSVTLTATSCDGLGNCGSQTYVVMVDRTPPAIVVTAPPRFVSAAFDIEATASDANGIGHFGMRSPLGADQDAAVGRVYIPRTAWTLSEPNGPLVVDFLGCDVVGNCTVAGNNLMVDRTAPTVAITSSVPEYTNQATITLSGTVSDGMGAGVARVLAQGSLTTTPVPVVATVSGGTWTVTVILEDNASNVIKVWAEDSAVPANGGPTANAPYVATATVGTDSNPPYVFTRSPPSYREERYLLVAKDAQGRPVMPVSYIYAGDKVAVGENGTVFKIRSKSGPSDDNVPFIRWAVLQDAAPGSPIVSGAYRVNFINSIYCGWCQSSALRLSTASERGYVLYELPLHLGTLGSEGSLDIGVTFSDAAGNTTHRSFRVSYVLVGAPVVAVLDSNFASYGDTESIYPYSTNANYPALIGTTKRVLRWVVYNPNQEVVWTALTHSGFSGSWNEIWFESNGYPTGGPMSDLGYTWNEYYDWYSKQYNANWPPWESECNPRTSSGKGIKDFPCAQSSVWFGYWYDPKPFHYFGDSATFTRCEAPHSGGTTASIGNSAYPNANALAVTPGLNVMENPLPTGKEPRVAPTVNFSGNSGWSIPAATSHTASAIAAYVTVSTPARAVGVPAATFPLSGTGQQRFRAGWYYDWTRNNSELACYVCRGVACLTYQADYYNQGWTARYFDRYLNQHRVDISGELTLKTYPSSVTTGTAISLWSNISYSFSEDR